jgi:hypothetical protein
MDPFVLGLMTDLMTRFRGFPGVSGLRVTYTTAHLRVGRPTVGAFQTAFPGYIVFTKVS